MSSDHLKKLRAETNKDKLDKFDEEDDLGQATSRKRPNRDKDSDSDEEQLEPQKRPFINDKPKQMSIGERLLAKQGYQEGKGLGKHGQGIVEPIKESTQRGRVGLGHGAGQALARDNNEFWDESAEEKTVKEDVDWIECDPDSADTVLDGVETEFDKWMVVGPRKESIDDETKYVDAEQLKQMLDAKSVFDSLTQRELNEARTRANPYETIGSAFFQNRAAMKTANMDAVFGFIFSQEFKLDTMRAKNPMDPSVEPTNADRSSEMFYFADVCAGPGGFSEYILWRKKYYNAKGFGFTLVGNNDFKLQNFRATSANYFEAFYGDANDGDVTNPDNIDSLEEHISKGTNGKGVHLMMADGGFCVDGKENIQEILSKRIYLCQLLVSLCIVREGGNFFCKLFDVFTPFSVGLVYLMYVCYEKISIHKPHTSRPANSERYIICKGLKAEPARIVREYLKKVNNKLEELEPERQHEVGHEREKAKMNRKYDNGQQKPKKPVKVQTEDVNELVPYEVMAGDDAFMEYIQKSNNKNVVRQRIYLEKYKSFAKNLNQIDRDQGKLREDCMDYWQIPNIPKEKNRAPAINSTDAFHKFTLKRKKSVVIGEADWSNRTPPLESKTHMNLNNQLYQHEEYECTFLGEKEPFILMSTGDQTFKRNFNMRNWEIAGESKYFRLPPDTLVLADITKSYGFKDKIDKDDCRTVIRIIDAAWLHGDDVGDLPYKDRMAAAEKMCMALDRVQTVISTGGRNRDVYIPHLIVAAQRFRLKELVDTPIRSNLNLTSQRGDQSVTFTEHGRAFFVRAVRGSCFVNADDNWHIYFSRSSKQLYASSPGRQPVFKGEWLKQGVYSSFWQTAMHRKSAVPRHAFIWRWEQNYDNGYGPRVILDDETNSGGLTLKYLANKIHTFERGDPPQK